VLLEKERRYTQKEEMCDYTVLEEHKNPVIYTHGWRRTIGRNAGRKAKGIPTIATMLLIEGLW
jgi:hypothetical protein